MSQLPGLLSLAMTNAEPSQGPPACLAWVFPPSVFTALGICLQGSLVKG